MSQGKIQEEFLYLASQKVWSHDRVSFQILFSGEPPIIAPGGIWPPLDTDLPTQQPLASTGRTSPGADGCLAPQNPDYSKQINALPDYSHATAQGSERQPERHVQARRALTRQQTSYSHRGDSTGEAEEEPGNGDIRPGRAGRCGSHPSWPEDCQNTPKNL